MRLFAINPIFDDKLLSKIHKIIGLNESYIDEDLTDNCEDMIRLLQRIADGDDMSSNEILQAAKFYRDIIKLIRQSHDNLFDLIDSIKTFGTGSK